MKKVATELESMITFAKCIAELSEAELSAKPVPTKWSKKEVLGHLSDSAENNLRRFICGQHESQPPKIRYDQNFWVSANDYKNAPTNNVIDHWKLINLKICRVLNTMPSENYSKNCDTGSETPVDYVKHIKHHLNQIIPGSFNIVYP